MQIKHTILLVDDEPSNIETLFNLLRHKNYNVIVANNGKTALSLVFKKMPAAIITDWDMPEMNGIEFIKEIRKNEDFKNIPILVATGKMTTIDDLTIAFHAGANDFIRKPFDAIEVETRVTAMIAYHESLMKIAELEKEIAEKEIENLKNQLATSTMKLVNEGRKNYKIINELTKIEKYTKPEGIRIIKRLINDLKINETLVNWEEFELLFGKIHNEFYNNLINSYPNLTKNERKLCIFIKLNMSNKDICAITMQSESAIKKARYRLRQKLKIDKNIKLSDFIASL